MINLIDENFLKCFGQNLKSLRESKKLSQRQLGEKVRIDASQIGRIERGEQNTTISTLRALAKALEMAPEELLKFSEKNQ